VLGYIRALVLHVEYHMDAFDTSAETARGVREVVSKECTTLRVLTVVVSTVLVVRRGGGAGGG